MNFPLITIGIPTYNRANGFLRQAIEAALNQTYENLEIIVSDNCSTDNTPQLVESYKCKQLKYVRHSKNIGAANNFNFCLEQAKGDYFLMLHDDDLIDPDFLGCCMEAASYSTIYGFIRTGTRIINEKNEVKREAPNRVKGLPMDDVLRGWFSGNTSIYLCSTLFNTKKLKGIGGFNSKRNLLQDCYAIVNLGAKYPRCDVEEVKASFRKHSGEITFAVKVKDWCDDFICLLDLINSTITGQDRNLIISEGKRFFSGLCYNRASVVPSCFSRFIAYSTVYHKFGFKYAPPPIRKFPSCIHQRLAKLLNYTK